LGFQVDIAFVLPTLKVNVGGDLRKQEEKGVIRLPL
jgi:hypothetical protein